MKNRLIRLVLLAVSIFIAAYLVPGIRVTNFWYALIVALFLTLINMTIKPILEILTLPITLLTFGLFLLVINALMILLVDDFMVNFHVNGFWNALLFNIVISVINWILNLFFAEED